MGGFLVLIINYQWFDSCNIALLDPICVISTGQRSLQPPHHHDRSFAMNAVFESVPVRLFVKIWSILCPFFDCDLQAITAQAVNEMIKVLYARAGPSHGKVPPLSSLKPSWRLL